MHLVYIVILYISDELSYLSKNVTFASHFLFALPIVRVNTNYLIIYLIYLIIYLSHLKMYTPNLFFSSSFKEKIEIFLRYISFILLITPNIIIIHFIYLKMFICVLFFIWLTHNKRRWKLSYNKYIPFLLVFTIYLIIYLEMYLLHLILKEVENDLRIYLINLVIQ